MLYSYECCWIYRRDREVSRFPFRWDYLELTNDCSACSTNVFSGADCMGDGEHITGDSTLR